MSLREDDSKVLDPWVPLQLWWRPRDIVLGVDGRLTLPRDGGSWMGGPAKPDGILSAFRQLTYGTDEQVRQFVKRFGLFNLDENGDPRWEYWNPGGHHYTTPQHVEWYRRLGAAADGVLLIASHERNSPYSPISVTAVEAVLAVLTRWSFRDEALQAADHMTTVRDPAGPFERRPRYQQVMTHAGSIAHSLRRRLAKRRRTSSGKVLAHEQPGQPALLTGLAETAATAWITASHATPTIMRDLSGRLCVGFHTDAFGAAALKLAYAVLKTPLVYTCASCNRSFETSRKRNPNRRNWCRDPVCIRDRDATLKREQRSDARASKRS